MYRVFGALDWIQRQLSRVGIRFQWPCWLLAYAWDWDAKHNGPELQGAGSQSPPCPHGWEQIAR